MTAREPTDEDVSTSLELVAVAAVAENGVIGADGEMPWHLPEDLARFKRRTIGHPVIMGRITYESIVDGLGEPLPERTSVVLTRRDLETPAGVRTASSVAEAVSEAEAAAEERHDGTDRAFVAGGASVYEQFMDLIERFLYTEVHAKPAGDTTFPEWDRDAWCERDCRAGEGCTFYELERRP